MIDPVFKTMEIVKKIDTILIFKSKKIITREEQGNEIDREE